MFEMDKFEEYFRTTERYQDFLCWGSDKWIFKSVDGRYLSEEIQRLYEAWQHQQAKVEEAEAHTLSVLETGEQLVQQVKDLIRDKAELQKRVDAALVRANQACISNEMFHKQFDDVIRILRGEQALKGEG